jgi:hypothetical protein
MRLSTTGLVHYKTQTRDCGTVLFRDGCYKPDDHNLATLKKDAADLSITLGTLYQSTRRYDAERGNAHTKPRLVKLCVCVCVCVCVQSANRC